MEPIKVLIVEDQWLIAQDIKIKLEDHNFKIIDMVTSGEKALEVVESAVPDLILMDIQLAGEMDGITTAEKIVQHHSIPIIYLSDYVDQETVTRAKKTNPANYLSKPFKKEDLLRALEIAYYNASHKKASLPSRLSDRILIRTDNNTADMISYSDIYYIEAARSYSYIHAKGRKYTLTNSMKKVLDKFESPDFVRVHRSYVVNLNHITGIEGNIIKMGDLRVEMSSKYRSVLMEKINFIK